MVRDPSPLPWYLDLDSSPWEAYQHATHVTLDLETTNASKGSPCHVGNRIVDAALSINGGPLVSGWDTVEPLLRTMSEPGSNMVILVAHNAKFEMGWMHRHGIPLNNFLPWDTLLAEYVLAGNRQVLLDLNSCAQRYGLGSKGRYIDRLMKAGVCPSEMPSHMLRQRVESDVRLTESLFYAQRSGALTPTLQKVLFTRCVVTPVLTQMESVGMKLDPQRVAVAYDCLLKSRAELATSLGLLSQGANLRSGPQMAALLYKTLQFRQPTDRHGNPLVTKTGRPRTDADTLASLRATTPRQREFLKQRAEFMKVDTALTKSMEFMYRVCTEKGGEFRAQFNQTRTRTHRLSSSGLKLQFDDGSERGIQFQNLPVVYKSLFVSRDSHSVLTEADGAQLEFRVAGSLARDPVILSDIQEGADVHRYTASVLHRVPEADVTKAQRNRAKADTFKPMYGGQSGTPRQKEYYAAFQQKYATLFQTQTDWTLSVLRDKELRLASGLVMYWPHARMSQDGYVSDTSAIFNYPVQSLATAEIIPVSLVYLFHMATAAIPGIKFVNTVHDSVVAEVPEKDLDRYKALVVECFLDRTYEYMDKVYGIDLYVPLGVSFRAGTHWGDGEEVTTSYPYKGRKSKS